MNVTTIDQALQTVLHDQAADLDWVSVARIRRVMNDQHGADQAAVDDALRSLAQAGSLRLRLVGDPSPFRTLDYQGSDYNMLRVRT